MGFTFQGLPIQGVILVRPRVMKDHRGIFMETYKSSAFHAAGIPPFVQDNYSSSTHRVLRGLHFQKPPRAQGKLVSVLRGEIYDVVVDIRAESSTYGRWTNVTLSATNGLMLYVPEGFAHGFCVTGDVADVVYKVTAEYDPALETGVRWDDPALGIKWPFVDPILSERDRRLPSLHSVHGAPSEVVL